MKRKMSILLILGLVLFIIPLTVHADAVSNGTCGENATWVLDDAGKLTISGTGAMSDISGSSPWHGQSINEVVIENGISRIGNYAFYGDSISKITIPESVSSIGKGALAYNYLSSIIVSESSPYFSVQQGILYNKDLTILIKCPETKTEISIPDSVATIGDFACIRSSLTSIVLPKNIKSIGENAFCYSASLTSVELSSNLETIGYYAFANCPFSSIFIPDGVTSIGSSAFRGCKNLTSIVLPDSVVEVGSNAFEDCTSLTKVTLPDGIKSIEFCTFNGCSSLANILIPDNVAMIDLQAFVNCTSLTNITIPDGVTTISDQAFQGCINLTNISIPLSTTEISSSSFLDCNNLSKITIHACNVEGIKYFTRNGFEASLDIIPHVLTKHGKVEKTCTETGTEEYWVCENSGKLFSDAEATTEIDAPIVIPAAHSLTEHSAVAADCTTTGNSVYWSCSECNKYFSDEAGKYEITANSWVIEANGHTLTLHAKEDATCTGTGIEAYWSCDVCNKLFSDSEDKEEIEEPIMIPALGHDWNEPVYDWNEDNTQVTATRVCKNNEEHTETETVNTSFEIKKKASAEAAGAIEYTSAAFVNEAFSVQSKTIELGRDVTLQLFDHVTVTVPSSFYLSESSATPTYLDKFSSIAMSYRTINVSTYQELRKKLKSAFGSISEFTLNGISMIGVAENHRTYKDSGVGFIVDNQAVMIMFVITDDTAGSISADIMNSITVTEIPGWQTIIPERNSTIRIPGTFVFEGERNELYEYSDSASGMELSHIVIDDPDTSYDTIKNMIGELAGYTVEKTNKNGYRIIAAANSSSNMKYFYAGYMSNTNKAVIIMIGYTVNDQMDICNAIVDSIASATGFMLDANGQWYYLLEGTRVINNWIEDNAVWYYFGTSGFMQTGWLNLAGTWYYFEDTGAMVIGWKSIDGTWYYFNSSGAMATGWVADGENWYYFQPSGAMTTGWLQGGSTWYYFAPSGAMVTGTQIIDGTEYIFDASGAWVENIVPAQTGWVQDGGVWYYYSDDGAMTIGWMKDGETWYYFAESGKMTTGWMKDGNTWYYFAESGKMTTGWMQDGTTWYYFGNNGAMVTGAQVINGTEYTFDASGAWVENTAPAQTGWVQDGGAWYYYDDNGAIVTGWKKVSGIWYHFAKSGKMTTGWFEDKEAEAQLPADQKKALWYWFDNGGKMATGWKEINGQWEMFADSGLWLYTWDGN